jgi:hypothetical protein
VPDLTTNNSKSGNAGLDSFLKYPVLEAILKRRSRRVSLGIGEVLAGDLTYRSDSPGRPLEPLDEAVLIAATGVLGNTTPSNSVIPAGRFDHAGNSPGVVQNSGSTHFFMLNDNGTWFLQRPDDLPSDWLRNENLSADHFIAHAKKCKVKVLDKRLDFERVPPAYLGRNKYVSNLPGTTMFVPVVDVSSQYIHNILNLLDQPDGSRPAFIDDFRCYRFAGVKKYVGSGYLSTDYSIPLGEIGKYRNHFEAELLVQNLLLTIQSIGLGGWVHAAFLPPLLLGDPEFVKDYGPGLGFRYEKPKRLLWRLLRFLKPLTAWRDNPVGLDGILEGHCPPYFPSMSAAVDAVVESRSGPDGSRDKEEAIACAKAVCEYIWRSYGRFPSHTDAIVAPGVWVQAHHLEHAYYDQLFVRGYTDTQKDHDRLWDGLS